MSRLDLVVFGATGFTGKHVVKKLIEISRKDKTLSWGIAGRSRAKLDLLIEELTEKNGDNLTSVPVIIADVTDEDSLKTMTSQAVVIVNCCGPYRHYGEPVIQACIATKTHHLDLSAEPQFIEVVHQEYHKLAQEAGVYIVTACGFDCIPNDMGVMFLKQNFKGQLNSVESYVTDITPETSVFSWLGTCIVNTGTWDSLIYSLANWHELAELRKNKPSPENPPTFKPKLKRRPIIHKQGNRWYLPFPSADEAIVQRTQQYFYNIEKERPVQFKVYVGFPGLILTTMALFVAMILFLLSRTRLTRKLLLKYPRICSLGLFSPKGPTEEIMNATKFTFYLRGEGWDEAVTDIMTTNPNKTMVAKVSGTNPGYGATVTGLVYSAITIIKEHDKMPAKGGVLTTGVAFSKTSLVNELNKNNFRFEILAS